MKNPYKIGDVVRMVASDPAGFYMRGAVGTVCTYDAVAIREEDETVWVDFNHPDNPTSVFDDGIWCANVEDCELIATSFTVVIERPEKLDGLFMRVTWVTVPAKSVEAAAEAARIEVRLADDEPRVGKDDYTVRAVFAGAHTNLYEGD